MALWTPLNLQSVTLEGWYRLNDPAGVLAPGADVLTQAGAVGTWKDRSGKGRDLVPEGSGLTWSPNAYGAGKPAINSTGAGQWRTPIGMNYPAAVLGAAILLRSDAGSNDTRAVSLIIRNGSDPYDKNGVIPVSKIGGEGKVGYWYSFNNSDTPVTLGAVTLVEGVPTSTRTAKTYVNGVASAGTVTHDNLGVTAMDRLGIMGTGMGGNRVVGGVSEAVLWSGVITPAELAQLQGYYAWNNGQQALLPASHAYKAAAPTVADSGGGTKPDPIPLKPLAKGGAFVGRAAGKLSTVVRPRAAPGKAGASSKFALGAVLRPRTVGGAMSARFAARIGLSLALRASAARFSGQAKPASSTRFLPRPARGVFGGRGAAAPVAPGSFRASPGVFLGRSRFTLSTVLRARQAPETFKGKARASIGYTFALRPARAAWSGQATFAKASPFRPKPAPATFKGQSHAWTGYPFHPLPAGGLFGGSGRLGRLAAAAIVLTPTQAPATFKGRARFVVGVTAKARPSPAAFGGRSSARLVYRFRGLARGGSFFARGFAVPVNPNADGRPYGPGDYGVGNYGSGTDVLLAFRASTRAGGRSKPAIGPVFHPKAARSTFKASARFVPWVPFRARPALGYGSGRFRPWVGPVFHPRASRGRFAGYMSALLQGKDLALLPGAMRGAGRSSSVLLFRAPFRPSPVRANGRALRFRTVVVWHKGPRLGSSWSGHWTAQIYPQVRVRGSERFKGRMGARMLFKAPFRASPGRYPGRVVVSYSWSNLSAPGRTPPPAWVAIPGAAPLDPWSLVPAADGAWTRAE